MIQFSEWLDLVNKSGLTSSFTKSSLGCIKKTACTSAVHLSLLFGEVWTIKKIRIVGYIKTQIIIQHLVHPHITMPIPTPLHTHTLPSTPAHTYAGSHTPEHTHTHPCNAHALAHPLTSVHTLAHTPSHLCTPAACANQNTHTCMT